MKHLFYCSIYFIFLHMKPQLKIENNTATRRNVCSLVYFLMTVVYSMDIDLYADDVGDAGD